MMKRRILVLSGLFVVLLLCCNTLAYAKIYTVKQGDNLFFISKRLGVSVNQIKKANHLKGNRLKPGQILNITQSNPVSTDVKKSKSQSASAKVGKSKFQNASLYTIKKGDTLSIISKKTSVPVKQIIALNHVNSRSLRIGHNLILLKQSVPSQTITEEDDLLGEEEDDEGIASSESSSDILCEAKTHEEFLGKWGSADERKLFIKVTTGFLGAPYRLGGATVKGIDCSAFVRKMYEFFDINLPRTAREQSAVGVRIDRDKLEEGDLVFFRTRKPIGHVGIYIGNNEFVHASYKSKSVRIDSLEQPYFQKRFQRAVRVKGLDENNGT